MAIRRAAIDISKGNLKKRVKVSGHDEISALADSFNEMAEQLESMDQTKSDFIHLAAHQLRTPHTIMSGYIEQLLTKFGSQMNIEEIEYLEAIRHGSDGLRDVTETLLNVSQLQRGGLSPQIQKVELKQLMADVMREYGLSIKNRHLKLDGKYDRKLPSIQTDPRLLRVMVRNLMTNAMYYTAKGSITVEINTGPGHVVISVKDTGCGIPEDEQARIFTKFFRADNAQRIVANGTGLGLYLVKLCADKLGGKVWFNSELGKGSTFFISLPRK